MEIKELSLCATNSDFLITIYLEPNVVDLRYFKLWILLDQTFWILNIKGLQVYNIRFQRFECWSLWQWLNSFIIEDIGNSIFNIHFIISFHPSFWSLTQSLSSKKTTSLIVNYSQQHLFLLAPSYSILLLPYFICQPNYPNVGWGRGDSRPIMKS